jgi:hypothetical protein
MVGVMLVEQEPFRDTMCFSTCMQENVFSNLLFLCFCTAVLQIVDPYVYSKTYLTI